MAQRLSRSLQYEYAIYLETEIELYKESVQRNVLLSIGDEAVRALELQSQIALTEIILCEEVDRIISRRLKLPAFPTWRKRRMKILAEQSRPEHWGLSRDDFVVRAASNVESDARVLVAGASLETNALFLAAKGHDVTAIAEPEAVQRVIDAAAEAGLGSRVHASTAALKSFTPAAPLTVVIYSSAAFAGLDAGERARVIATLQSATLDGGVHLVQTIVAGKQASISLDELRRRYSGWDVTTDKSRPNTFFARKGINELQV